MKVVNTGSEARTAEKLLAHTRNVINIMKTEFQVDVAAFSTDDSGESKKTRKVL